MRRLRGHVPRGWRASIPCCREISEKIPERCFRQRCGSCGPVFPSSVKAAAEFPSLSVAREEGDSRQQKVEGGEGRPSLFELRVERLRRRGERLPQARDEQEKSKVKSPTRKNDVWAPKLVAGFFVRAAARRSATQATARVPIETQKPRAWTEPRHAACEVSRWIYGYGRYLHRSFSNLKPLPVEPVASKPSPPNIQNICSPDCAGAVVQ